MCKVVYRLVILAGLGALPGMRAAEVPAVTPKPIPLLAWSLAELNRDRPWIPSPYPHITGFFWLTQGNVKDPAAAKRLIDQQPAGRRVIFDWDVYRSAYQHPADKLTTAAGEAFTGPWWDHGLADVEATYDAFFRAYREAGGQLDYYLIDTEHNPSTEITTPERWAAVEQDPRCREFLAAMRLSSVAEIQNAKPFSFTLWRYADYLACQRYNRLYAIVKRYFPAVKCSDYGQGYHPAAPLAAWGETRDPGDIPGRLGGHVGTHQAPSLYGVLTYAGTVVVEGKPFGLGPFRSALYATNQLREALLANPAVPLMPWVAWRGYVSDWEDKPKDQRPPYSSIGGSDYFQEVFFHAALCNPDTILVWDPFRWQEKQDPATLCQDQDLVLLNDLAAQVNGLVGFSDRATLVTATTPAHQPFLLSGCIANGRSLWRLTPDPEQSPVEWARIMVKDEPLTLKLGTVTLTLPGGTLLTPAKPLSTVGHWIVGPADLKPTLAP
jgi:hypothetical protein